ncbi:MAG: hypothetical protein JXR71_01550 [Bacteroidales bacterium]|nr:hypothetical protein [Bacteroidales bacterium]
MSQVANPDGSGEAIYCRTLNIIYMQIASSPDQSGSELNFGRKEKSA